MPRTTINSSGARGRAASNLTSKPARKTKGKANGKSSSVKANAKASDEEGVSASNDEVTNNNDNDAISAPSDQRKRKASESLSDSSPSRKVAKTDHGSAGDENPGSESVASDEQGSGQQSSEEKYPERDDSEKRASEQNDSEHDDEEDANGGGGDEANDQEGKDDQDNADAASISSEVTGTSDDSLDYYKPNPLNLPAHRILVILNPYVPEAPTEELMQKVRDARDMIQSFTDPGSADPATELLMTLAATILLLEQLFEVESRGAKNRVYVSDETVATMRQIDADIAALDRIKREIRQMIIDDIVGEEK